VNTNIKAHAALFLVALIYGANYIIAKEVMGDGQSVAPLALVMMRAIAGLILFSIFHILFVRERIQRRDVGLIMLAAFFGIAMNQMFFLMGLQRTTPINASLIQTSTPIMVLLASALLIREKITRRKLLGIFLGASGAIILISYGQQINFNIKSLTGDLMILTNATFFGLFLVVGRTLMQKYHPITVSRWLFTFGIFYIMPFGLPPFLQTDWSALSAGTWWGIAYVLIGTTFLAYLFNTYALKLVSPAIVSIYIYLQPLFASLLSLTLGMEKLSLGKLLAGFLIFTGVYLVSYTPKRKKKFSIHIKFP
jgi:drug/metabolite transporter (DMT)-like permease